jgi:hypothetical protein
MADCNASVIPVKVKIVKECARIEREFQLTKLRTDVLNLAKDIVEATIAENRGWWRRTFGKQLEVPDPTALADKWYAEHAEGKLYWESNAGWKFARVKTGWWQRLKQLEALPEETENEVMMLSLEDAKLIEFNFNYEKAAQS